MNRNKQDNSFRPRPVALICSKLRCSRALQNAKTPGKTTNPAPAPAEKTIFFLTKQSHSIRPPAHHIFRPRLNRRRPSGIIGHRSAARSAAGLANLPGRARIGDLRHESSGLRPKVAGSIPVGSNSFCWQVPPAALAIARPGTGGAISSGRQARQVVPSLANGSGLGPTIRQPLRSGALAACGGSPRVWLFTPDPIGIPGK